MLMTAVDSGLVVSLEQAEKLKSSQAADENPDGLDQGSDADLGKS